MKGGTKWLVVLLSAWLVVGCGTAVPSSGGSSDAGVKELSGSVRMSSPVPSSSAASTASSTTTPKLTAQASTVSRAEKRAAWVEKVRRCIVKRESGGNPKAQNPVSTASGLYQFLDSSFQATTGLPGSASDYSARVQTKAFYKLFANGKGRHHWYLKGGPNCW